MRTSEKRSWRPDTLKEAVRRHLEENESFTDSLRDFYMTAYETNPVDHFALFSEEPDLCPEDWKNAYAAAVAEWFALRYGFSVPEWALDKKKKIPGHAAARILLKRGFRFMI